MVFDTFDTMRSFQHLSLDFIPRSRDVVGSTTHPRRQDPFTIGATTRQQQEKRRTRMPSPLPSNIPSFQKAKARWSPPSSPTANSPASSPPVSPQCSKVRMCAHPPLMDVRQKRVLANSLFTAACSGDLLGIERLLDEGAPIDSPVMIAGLFEAFKPAKAGHLSPLAGAASYGQFEAVELLLAHGAEINPSSAQCASSPLHQAIRNNDLELSLLLLEQGADVNIDNAYKTTPIMYAAKYGSADLVSLLLEYRPDLNKLSFTQMSALHWSVWPGITNITELLLKAGADPNQMDHGCNTPLHCAVVAGSTNMVECLLRYGANPTQRNEENDTAFELAAGQPDMEEITRLLMAAMSSRR